MNTDQHITFKMSVRPANFICDYEYSGRHVKKFKIKALCNNEEVGHLRGYIYDMYSMMECGRLYLAKNLFKASINSFLNPLSISSWLSLKGFP